MRLPLTLSALAALTPTLGPLPGCGKDPNDGAPAFLQFAHGFPEAPRPLRSGPRLGPVGSGLLVRGESVLALDILGGTLVEVPRAGLSAEASAPRAASRVIPLGGRPEMLVPAADGGVFVSLRSGRGGEGEVVRLDAGLTVRERVPLGGDVFGLACSPDGATVWATLPFEGALVALREVGGEDGAPRWEEVARVDVGQLPRGLAWVPASAGDLGAGAVLVALQHGAIARVPLGEDGLPASGAAASALPLRAANPAEFRAADGSLRPFMLRPTRPTRAVSMAVNPESGEAYVAHVVAAPGDPLTLLQSVKGATEAASAPAGYGDSGGAVVGGRTFAPPSRPLEATVSVIGAGGAEVAWPEDGLSVRDPATGRPMTQLVDQPSALAHHPDHSLLFVAGEGSNNVLVLSTAEGDPMRSPLAVIEVGAAPRAVAFSEDGDTAYVLSAHDLAVESIDVRPLRSLPTMAAREVLPDRGPDASAVPAPTAAPVDPETGRSSGSAPGSSELPEGPVVRPDPTPDSLRVAPVRLLPTARVVLGVDPRSPAVIRGARLFTEATNAAVSHAGQFACASCHFEGLDDGVTWVTPDGLRQTIALGGRLEGTGPFNWSGSEVALASNMDKTIARMGGSGLDAPALADLEAFLLAGLPEPAGRGVRAGGLTAEEQLGASLFSDPEVGCASCHRPELAFTDGLSHDVGTFPEVERQAWDLRAQMEPGRSSGSAPGSSGLPPLRLNTPSLTGLAWTAPYLHDGSAADLLGLLMRTGDGMGRTSHLSSEELKALVAYLKTL